MTDGSYVRRGVVLHEWEGELALQFHLAGRRKRCLVEGVEVVDTERDAVAEALAARELRRVPGLGALSSGTGDGHPAGGC